MECTALVVYEDWHRLQARQQARQHVLKELFKKLSEALEPILHRTIDSLKEFFDNLDLNSYDDSDTVLMKCYNRYDYLHTKQYIAQKQYYNNQFKLARMHICIANHIKH